MKNIILIFALIAAISANAQTVTPRTGTGANNDNTFRAMTVKYVAVTDATGNDTTKINFNAYQTLVRIDTLKDSVSLNFTPVSRCYFGDRATVIVKNGANAGKVKLAGSNIEVGSAGTTLSITAAKLAVIEFVFNGYKWLETNRIVQ